MLPSTLIRALHTMDADEKHLLVATLDAIAVGEVTPDELVEAFEAGLAELRSGGAGPLLKRAPRSPQDRRGLHAVSSG